MDGPYSLLFQSTQRVVQVWYGHLIHVDPIVQIYTCDLDPRREDEVLGFLLRLLVVCLSDMSQQTVTQSN